MRQKKLLKQYWREQREKALKRRERMMTVRYTHEDIQLCLDCLNSMNVSGIEAMKRIVMIADKLMNPLPEPAERKEEPDASHKEK